MVVKVVVTRHVAHVNVTVCTYKLNYVLVQARRGGAGGGGGRYWRPAFVWDVGLVRTYAQPGQLGGARAARPAPAAPAWGTAGSYAGVGW